MAKIFILQTTQLSKHLPPAFDHTVGDAKSSSCLSNTNKCDIIEHESKLHSAKSFKRLKIFSNIVENREDQSLNFWYILCGFIGVGMTIVLNSVYTLVPTHDVMIEPKYWYEFILQLQIALFPLYAINIVLRAAYWMNVTFIKHFKHFAKVWITGAGMSILLSVIVFFIWIYILKLHYPFPFYGLIFGMFTIVVMYIVLWFQFDKEIRQNILFRKRMVNFMLATLSYQLVVTELSVIKSLFIQTPEEYQWLIAFILPIIKELNTRLVMKFARKGAQGDTGSLRITYNQAMETEYAFFLALVVGSVATFSTSVTIFIIDIFAHILTCFKIVRAKKKDEKEKLIELVQDLVVSETVELTVPLAYIGCLIQGYYGPNNSIIGNIGSHYWQYTVVDDIMHPVRYVLGFFFIDFCCVIVSAYLIWQYCRINIFRAYIELTKEFGVYFALRLAGSVTAVSCKLILNLKKDETVIDTQEPKI